MLDRNNCVTKEDWETSPMPRRKESGVLERSFSENEINKIKQGFIPQEQEDRWFLYFEDNKLYIHRSWSGICIYIVKFNFEKMKHKVLVNSNKKQYEPRDMKSEIKTVNHLINHFLLNKEHYERNSRE